MQRLAGDMDLLNDWTGRLWKGDEQEALQAADTLFRDPGALPGSGRGASGRRTPTCPRVQRLVHAAVVWAMSPAPITSQSGNCSEPAAMAATIAPDIASSRDASSISAA